MTKKHWSAIIWVFTAIAIVASALLLKDTEYENAWIWILFAGAILSGVFEVYSQIKDKNRDKQ